MVGLLKLTVYSMIWFARRILFKRGEGLLQQSLDFYCVVLRVVFVFHQEKLTRTNRRQNEELRARKELKEGNLDRWGVLQRLTVISIQDKETELFHSFVGEENEPIKQISGSERNNFIYSQRIRNNYWTKRPDTAATGLTLFCQTKRNEMKR